jgi:peptidoglycan/LPS O-acetylase OafA/YrhL
VEAAELANQGVHTRTADSGPLHIASLDGIRAVAFFVVFIAHAGVIGGPGFPGHFGLSLFFFLSGYLITTLMRVEYDRSQDVHLGHFYLRRVLRIFPPFYLVLWVTAALIAAGYFVGEVDAFPVLMQSLHLSNYHLIINGHAGYPLGTFAYWSLAVEEHFYLGFPLLYLTMRRRGLTARQQALVLGGICAAVLAWRAVLVVLLDASVNRTYLATDTRIDSILFGCILAVCGNPAFEANRLAKVSVARVLCPIAAVALLVAFVVPGNLFRETVRYTIEGLAIYPLFIAAVAYPGWGLFRILNLGPVRFLGALSYSLYLMHEIAIYNLYDRFPVPRVVEAALALGVSLAASIAIYLLIERPIAQLRRRLSHQGRARAERGATAGVLAAQSATE